MPQRSAALGAVDGRGRAAAEILPVIAGFAPVSIGAGRSDGAASFSRSLDGAAAAGVGEDAEVSDAVHAVGQHMEQEAAHELLDGNGGGGVARLFLPRRFRLSVPEGDGMAVEGGDAAVGDSDPVGVSGQVSEHLLRSPEGLLAIDHQMLRSFLCCGGSKVSGQTATSLEPPQHDLLNGACIREPGLRQGGAPPRPGSRRSASSLSTRSGAPVAANAPGSPQRHDVPGSTMIASFPEVLNTPEPLSRSVEAGTSGMTRSSTKGRHDHVRRSFHRWPHHREIPRGTAPRREASLA